MLTDTKLRNLKPKDKLYKMNDRDGLYVAVTPKGTVSFRHNYSISGRQETLTIGRYGVELHRILSQLTPIFSCWNDPHLGREIPLNSTP